MGRKVRKTSQVNKVREFIKVTANKQTEIIKNNHPQNPPRLLHQVIAATIIQKSNVIELAHSGK